MHNLNFDDLKYFPAGCRMILLFFHCLDHGRCICRMIMYTTVITCYDAAGM